MNDQASGERAAAPAEAEHHLSGRIATAVAGMAPAYFAMVMATGIISIACQLLGMRFLAQALLGLNLAFYLILGGLLLWRTIRYTERVTADLLSHARCVGFFTTVAATCVLGNQFLVVVEFRAVALALAVFGTLLWFAFSYGLFAVLAVKRDKPALAAGLNGGWLVMVVATQAVSALASQLAIEFGSYERHVLLFALAMWMIGGMMYLWIISLIFYRYMFYPLEPTDLGPPYWINMGAMAISTLSGTLLIAAAPDSPLLSELLPFLKGATVFCWATATWWIPALLILGVWRHGIRGYPLRYDPLYWGAVFPLGMYTVCTFRLSTNIAAPYLGTLAGGFLYVALAAWLATALGLAHALIRLMRPA